MDKKYLLKVVNIVIEKWSELDEKHRGHEYQKAVDNLNKLAEDLKKEIDT